MPNSRIRMPRISNVSPLSLQLGRRCSPLRPPSEADPPAETTRQLKRPSFLILEAAVPWLGRELQRRSRWAPAGLRALPAAQATGQVMHAGGRWMAQHGQVLIGLCLAAGALNLQQWITAIECLVDRSGGVDRLAVRPHPLVPAIAEQSVGLPDQCVALEPHLVRLGGEEACHPTRCAELLRQGFPVTSGEGRWPGAKHRQRAIVRRAIWHVFCAITISLPVE